MSDNLRRCSTARRYERRSPRVRRADVLTTSWARNASRATSSWRRRARRPPRGRRRRHPLGHGATGSRLSTLQRRCRERRCHRKDGDARLAVVARPTTPAGEGRRFMSDDSASACWATDRRRTAVAEMREARAGQIEAIRSCGPKLAACSTARAATSRRSSGALGPRGRGHGRHGPGARLLSYAHGGGRHVGSPTKKTACCSPSTARSLWEAARGERRAAALRGRGGGSVAVIGS